MNTVNERICPLCGRANQCALAAGGDAADCWCRDVVIDTAILQRLPDAAVGKACICRACAEARGENVIER